MIKQRKLATNILVGKTNQLKYQLFIDSFWILLKDSSVVKKVLDLWFGCPNEIYVEWNFLVLLTLNAKKCINEEMSVFIFTYAKKILKKQLNKNVNINI